MDHLKAALNRKHPFETGITLPLSLEAAIETQLSLTPDEIIRRRKLTMKAIKKRAVALESATTTSQAPIHSDVAKIAGNLNLDLLEELIDLTDYPDRALVEDLRNGMPVVGHMTVAPGVFAPPRPPTDSDGKEKVISLDELHRRARSARASIINSICEEGFKAEVWEGTLQEVEKGHLEGPLQLTAIESSFENPVIVRRFPVHQSDKTRLCDDYKRSTNLNKFGDVLWAARNPTHPPDPDRCMETSEQGCRRLQFPDLQG
ncbi:hypothetical protein Pmar_PMAR012985 [Perkinsus marinus ATCC 50983]|uniref:Uncharacterized protein n=1 Tax=Perkinsus marinus (strain ATCC 50983 / TXsc) TaxID=423536 RepID=C5KZC9_PERM5|nr:hypothetical protein Pmar_PMAR012985 [Perkinsus marinus ATCC 50983]EER10160.1 hypothetical protein Pmar_PMAR012985 [Perkinsus marinus ATCC 50983]|eukprot:XP_002778365.1 hypothetical protein Pmar_PMAR012985 [Perkinsus marinus ATCC 50983]